MKRKVLVSLLVIAVVAGLVGAGTWAYFRDTETSTSNSFTAGTLDLGLANIANQNSRVSVEDTYVTPSNWAPGQTEDATLYVNLEGNIDAYYVLLDFEATYTEGTPATVDTGTSTLGNSIIATEITWNGVPLVGYPGLTLAQLVEQTPYNLGGLPANTEYPLYILWTLNPAADNGVQGDIAGITLSFLASQ